MVAAFEAATRKGSWLARPSEAAFRSVVSTLATGVLVFSSSPVYHYITLYLVPRRVAVPPRPGYMTRRPVTLSFLYDSSPRTELTTPTPECTHRRSLRCPWCVAGRCHVESARISFDVRRAVTWAPGRSTADPRPKRARLPLRFERGGARPVYIYSSHLTHSVDTSSLTSIFGGGSLGFHFHASCRTLSTLSRSACQNAPRERPRRPGAQRQPQLGRDQVQLRWQLCFPASVRSEALRELLPLCLAAGSLAE